MEREEIKNQYLNYLKDRYEQKKSLVEKLAIDKTDTFALSKAKKEKLALRDEIQKIEKNFN
jgi:hypothetical protein